MLTAQLALCPSDATSRPPSEFPLPRRNQLRGLRPTHPRKAGGRPQQGIATSGEHALGSTWEFAVVSARTSRPTISAIPRAYGARWAVNIDAEPQVGRIPNETCREA